LLQALERYRRLEISSFRHLNHKNATWMYLR